MAHYTLFCNLAGAHAQVRALSNIQRPMSSRVNWFKHWEAFDTAYLHLGIALYETYHLWDLVLVLRGVVEWKSKDRRIGPIQGAGQISTLREEEFRSWRKLWVWRDFQRVADYVSDRRDNLTHYSRGTWMPAGDEVSVPIKVRRNVRWSEESKSKEWWITTTRAQIDLESVEDSINKSHEVLIPSFQTFLEQRGIMVRSS